LGVSIGRGRASRTTHVERGIAELAGIVVAAGSGSTGGGFAGSILETRVARRVIACKSRRIRCCARSSSDRRSYTLWRQSRPLRTLRALRCLEIEGRFVGGGYGHASTSGDAASNLARSFGLALEPTYTAKAFAAALERVRAPIAPASAANSNCISAKPICIGILSRPFH
jgi:D-cysteine desulfhydrase